jgi:hypothetical protein
LVVYYLKSKLFFTKPSVSTLGSDKEKLALFIACRRG